MFTHANRRINFLKKKRETQRHSCHCETADKLSHGCSIGCQMLSQSNIKPYVGLLRVLIAGAEQSIGTMREVLRGGAGCEIKGLWRKTCQRLSDHIVVSERREKTLWYARISTHTHAHMHSTSPPPHDQKLECAHISTCTAALSIMNMIIGQVSSVRPINILSTSEGLIESR